MIDLKNNTVDLDFFIKLTEILTSNSKMVNDNIMDILDSFGPNQFASKTNLINMLIDLNMINDNMNVAIFGSWYGSILGSVLSPLVNNITCYDIDSTTLNIGKKIFNNITFIRQDVLSKDMIKYLDQHDLIINTSCEHMNPMIEWEYFDAVKDQTYFALQSNNMFDVEGHINCVNTLEDFEMQMPMNFEILFSNSISVPGGWKDSNGKRFTIIGKKSG